MTDSQDTIVAAARGALDGFFAALNVEDAEAIEKGRVISREVAAAASDHSGPAMHISVMNEAGQEVQQIPVIWPGAN